MFSSMSRAITLRLFSRCTSACTTTSVSGSKHCWLDPITAKGLPFFLPCLKRACTMAANSLTTGPQTRGGVGLRAQTASYDGYLRYPHEPCGASMSSSWLAAAGTVPRRTRSLDAIADMIEGLKLWELWCSLGWHD